MLAASFSLVYEGFEYNVWTTLLGILTGLGFIHWTHPLLENRDGLSIANLQGADAMKALMIMGVMTLHSFSEGVGVGVSFGGGEKLGVFITLAIALHNVPEGLAISLILVPRGFSVAKAAWWSIISSLPQPLMAVPAFLFVETFRPFLPVGLGFAAGAMIWMVFAEIIPEAEKEAGSHAIAVTVTLSIVAMLGFQQLF